MGGRPGRSRPPFAGLIAQDTAGEGPEPVLEAVLNRVRDVAGKFMRARSVPVRTNQPKPGAAHAMLAGILILLAGVAWAADAAKGTAALIDQLGEDAFAKKKAAIEALSHTRDMRLLAFFDSYNKAEVYLHNGKVVLKGSAEGGQVHLLEPLDRKDMGVVPIAEVKDLDIGNRERRLVRDALTLLRLSDPDREKRLAAIIRAGDSGAEANLATLRELQKSETDKRVNSAIAESIALIQLNQDDPKLRLEAAKTLGERGSARALPRIKELAKAEKDPGAVAIYAAAVKRIEHWQSVVDWTGYLFSGLSLGSILVLMALGLSIIFGLMGVINMAHGELMMIGAYATLLTQMAFEQFLPESAFNWYFIVAMPASFLAAAFVGYLIEVLVVRHLYGRPLDTLLATWGVGWILIQAIRLWFGDNRAVNSPTWLRGGLELGGDITLPYVRLFIIGFCIACILATYWLMAKTKLGLLIRAPTQSRSMASALGVPTRRIDAYTFALGAGFAGLAGAALTQIGGVTPDMGQNYVVDSFMVVVMGGVGKLAGAIWAGLGLGVTNKLLEPLFESVWAKVLILILVVIFIQFKPSGLFPAKGRSADA
jgi:urea transport system permease protein